MLRFLFILCALSLLASCKSKKSDGKHKEQLLKLNSIYDSAIVRKDTGLLKKLYADDFIYTNPEGRVLTKQQQIGSLAVSEVNLASGRSEDVKITVYGGTAVMTGAFLANGTYRGNPLSIHERYTTVWVRTDTSWRMVAEQGNIIQ